MRNVLNSLMLALMLGTVVANFALWTAWAITEGPEEFRILLEAFLPIFGLSLLAVSQVHIWASEIRDWRRKLCFVAGANALLAAPFVVVFLCV